MKPRKMRRCPVSLLFVAALLAGCQEGRYRYDYAGRVVRADGVTPAAGVPLVAHPARREGFFRPKFPLDDPRVVVSGGDGSFRGTTEGWFAAPLLWPVLPQECKADKLWVYLPADRAKQTWKAVVVPVTVRKADRPCTGRFDDVRVILPGWYAE